MIRHPPPQQRVWLLLGVLGLAVRIIQVTWTWGSAPHPDLGSFIDAGLTATHPFDTSPREPFFVWWLWLLGRFGIADTGPIRLAGTVWFLPNLFLLAALARKRLSAPIALGVGAVYAFLPAQVVSDGLGLRHLIETTGTMALLWTLDQFPTLKTKGSWWMASASQAVLTLTRVSFLVSGAGLLLLGALRARSLRPMWAVLPALVLVLFHFQNNQRKSGDPLRSVNLHAYWYANLEFVGHPGFHATEEERQRDTYRPSLSYRQWAYEWHTPMEFVKETVKGYGKFFWTFFNTVYFRANLPGFLRITFMILWLGALLWALGHSTLWPALGALLVLIYPYAFVGHIFWAGRFFVPYAPIALILMGYLIAGVYSRLQKKWPLISRAESNGPG